MRYLVILDDGHGNDTSGKRTPIFSDRTYLKENEFNSEVVQLIYNKFKNASNFDVFLTAPEGYDVPLDKRIERANQAWKDHQNYYGAVNSKCILISVHANAFGSGEVFNTAKGVETYCCSSPSSERVLAEIIHKHIKGGTTQVDRGVQEICFAILKGNMTSCLVECAFMTNLDEANLLKQEVFRQECADEIVAGILEYFGINQVEKAEVNYKVYNDGTCELKGNPLDLSNKIVNKSNRSIEEPNCVNGTFFWYEDEAKTKTYPTSILIIDGKIYRNEANHLEDFNATQSVFIVYKNGKVDMKRVKYATELDYQNIKVAVGGVGLRNTLDSTFKYSPVTEGFKAGYRLQDGKWVDYTDVLKTRPKTVIGYNKTNGKAYLLARKDISHGNLINLISDNSTGEAYDIALSLDGGGSTFMNNDRDMVLYGDGRIVHNIIGFMLQNNRI